MELVSGFRRQDTASFGKNVGNLFPRWCGFEGVADAAGAAAAAAPLSDARSLP